MDQVLLSRIQFAMTAGYHFIFVPISIGIGLMMAIFVTRAYRSNNAEDDAIARMWVKIFTGTFAIGVATGITMEFSFGTNWANYARFVGDIFGAPLAAEALFAFFLESIFLGILIFGRKKIKPLFYTISAWLVFGGSALSALWIIIANSWMQTPAGAELSEDGTQAVITDFFAAAFNPSTLPRYFHTVLAILVMGAFITVAVAAWYMRKERKQAKAASLGQAKVASSGQASEKAQPVGSAQPAGASEKDLPASKTSGIGTRISSAQKMLRCGLVVAAVATVALLVSAHSSAVVVWEEQPTKMAMMEGLYEEEAPALYAFGFVDENGEITYGLGLPGGTSFLATGTWDTEYPGLNDLAETEEYSDIVVEEMPTLFVFETYHLMVAMFGLIVLVLVLAFVFNRKGAKRKIQDMRWLQWLLIICPIFPFVAIQSGWLTAEVGRQPYVVYPSTSGPDGVYMLTSEGTSVSVQPFELIITLVLFVLVYVLLFVGWARVMARFVNAGPVHDAGDKPAQGKEEQK